MQSRRPDPDNAGGGMLMFIYIIGFLASLTSVISLIPQVIKMFQTHSVGDISFWMIFNFIVTSILWIIYGLMVDSASVWGANCFMLLFAAFMMYFKIRYRNVCSSKVINSVTPQ